MPAKKSAKKSTSGAKKNVAKKAVKKVSKKAAKNAAGNVKPKASEIIRQSSHTPAIFKNNAKRPTNVLFTLDDVREVLKKRAEEEKREAKEAQSKKKAVKKAAGQKVTIAEETLAQKSRHQAASLDDILGLNPFIGAAGVKKDKIPRKFAKYHRLLIELL